MSDLRHRTDDAIRAAERAVTSGPAMYCAQWRGEQYPELHPDERQERALDALDALTAAVATVQAARDALEAELVDAGVIAGPPERPTEDYPDAAWKRLEEEGHWSTPPARLARLVVSDRAADVADTARGMVPTEGRPRGALVGAARLVVQEAEELLTSAVIAEHLAGMPWAEIDEELSGGAAARQPAEAHYAAAVASWRNGVLTPYHYSPNTTFGAALLPEAALRPRSTARRLDKWVVEHRSPRDRRGQGDAPVSAALTAPVDGLTASSWLIDISGSIISLPWGRGVGPEGRCLQERKGAAMKALVAARPADIRLAEQFAEARARLAELRGDQTDTECHPSLDTGPTPAGLTDDKD
ncbi:hypothetical protein [Protofrankia sp. BMG5.30]|uniref:hypothetical protein n=1 Tax=Protofrankia sp. BMG5.30 TaxID=1834514 RepID=UPI0011155410|nr:hypothetical protein [Protofrankia sp. BMG5.30]